MWHRSSSTVLRTSRSQFNQWLQQCFRDGLLQQPQRMHVNDMAAQMVLGGNCPVHVVQRRMGAEFVGHPTVTGVAKTWNDLVHEEVFQELQQEEEDIACTETTKEQENHWKYLRETKSLKPDDIFHSLKIINNDFIVANLRFGHFTTRVVNEIMFVDWMLQHIHPEYGTLAAKFVATLLAETAKQSKPWAENNRLALPAAWHEESFWTKHVLGASTDYIET